MNASVDGIAPRGGQGSAGFSVKCAMGKRGPSVENASLCQKQL